MNIVSRQILDVDRNVMTPLDQVYLYPNWEEAEEELEKLRNERKRIWREPSLKQKIIASLKKMKIVKFLRDPVKRMIIKK